jgi:RPA family protein
MNRISAGSQISYDSPPTRIELFLTLRRAECARTWPIEPESITDVDEAIRDARVAETASQTRECLEAFESGDAPSGEETTGANGEDVSAIEAAVSAVEPDDPA